MLESSEVKMYQTILFDLDSTSTDSGSDIMRSILYATEQLEAASSRGDVTFFHRAALP